MATWESDKAWLYGDPEGNGTGLVTWEYHTTSDILTVRSAMGESRVWGTVHPAHTEEALYFPDQAKAVLHAMLDWDARYNNGRFYKEWTTEASEKG